MSLTGDNLRRLVELAARPAEGGDPSSGIPSAGPRGEPRTLTIGIATRGDADSTYLSVTAARLTHVAELDRINFLVVDSDPSGPNAWSLKALEWDVPGLRYVPAGDTNGTAAARDRVFREANSDWVLSLDAGVLLVPGALRRLLKFIDDDPNCVDLLQGPQLHDDLSSVSTHWSPVWRDGRFGVAEFEARGVDPDGAPFEIPAQSLELFACRRAAWLGFNPRFRGPATDEGYLHHKFRRSGRRTLCLPFLRWMRRTPATASETDAGDWEGRIRNYLIGWAELGLQTEPLTEHFAEHFSHDAMLVARTRWETEKSNPFNAFDGIFCINLDSRPDRWERMQRRFEALGIADRVRRMPGISTPWNYHVGCALSHRKVIEAARHESMRSVLIFEDDTVFLQGATWVLRRSLRELESQKWKLLYLGTFGTLEFPTPPLPLVDDCHHLVAPEGVLLGAHAVAYHHTGFDELLLQIPDTIEDMEDWAARHPIDVFISQALDGIFQVSPMIATQEPLIPSMPKDLRDQYVLGV